MFLRSGERVLIALSSFHAATFDELYEGIYSIPWENYLCRDARIVMDGKSNYSALGAIKAAGGVAKKAIIRRLADRLNARGKQGAAATFPETGERTIVGVSIYKDTATVTIDTSGEGLHKRGYRSLAYDAPLKETLAAGIIDMTYYHGDFSKPFADPFCGSGTIPIEAALIAKNRAPGLNRDFTAMNWSIFERSVWQQARDEARSKEFHGDYNIVGSDIDPKAIEIARENARRAGVDDVVRFEVADATKFDRRTERGVIVTNPPYGERIMEKQQAEELYRGFGRAWLASENWQLYLLSSHTEFERCFGKQADKKRKLYNGMIKCDLFMYFK